MALQFPVSTVDETYAACNPEEPLPADDPRYTDLSEARGSANLAITLAQRIKRTLPPDYHRQLVAGHRGSGKSTELRRLRKRLEEMEYFVVYLDVETALDPGEIQYQDVLLAIIKAVNEQVAHAEVNLDPKLLSDVEEFFSERLITDVEREEAEVSTGVKAEVGVGIPLLKLLSNITAQFKSGSSRRVEIRRKVEQELSAFTGYLNLLIGQARVSLQAAGYSDVVIIVDGLEKMQFRKEEDGHSNHFELYVVHAKQLKAPEAHLIYTVPIWLAFDAHLGDAFADAVFVIPMVKTMQDIGREAFLSLVSKRVQVDRVFESIDSVYEMIEMSGGAARDLLRLIRMACDGVDEKISPADVRRAIAALVREYDRLFRYEDLETLKQVRIDKRIDYHPESSRLLQLRLVHEYQNEKRWADLHPAVKRIMDTIREQ